MARAAPKFNATRRRDASPGLIPPIWQFLEAVFYFRHSEPRQGPV